MLTVSIVSHDQASLMSTCLEDLIACPEVRRIFITGNLPGSLPVVPATLSRRVTLIENVRPCGFGANHNAAFRHCVTPFYCVLNPDIRLPNNPFPALLGAMEEQPAGLVGPAVLSSAGIIEDSVRHFPTLASLLAKGLSGRSGSYAYELGAKAFPADWVGGMCMLFRSDDFRAVGGFDEDFFLYYEDVDICARLWKAGRRVLACPQAWVIHDARRASRQNFRYMRWHVASLARYLWKHTGRLPVAR